MPLLLLTEFVVVLIKLMSDGGRDDGDGDDDGDDDHDDDDDDVGYYCCRCLLL